MLVASIGRQGTELFALDITNPLKPRLLWDIVGTIYQAGTQQRSCYGGKFRRACEYVRSGRIGQLKSVYANIGSQIGYTTVHRDISWRFLAIGLLFTMAAAGTAMLWGGRLV